MTPEDLAQRFEARFGSRPDGVWRAPGRVNLIGEHTDYNAGFVLPFAVPLETVAAARRRDDGVVWCSSVEMGDASEARSTELVPSDGWWSYVHGVVEGMARATGDAGGVDLLISSNVPIGAGLSSSAALECVVAVALRDLIGAELSDIELALLAQRAENGFAGVPCGVMDQVASMLGRDDRALLIDTRSLDVDHVPFPPHGIRALVIDTRTTRTLTEGGYAERRAACEEAARVLGVAALRDVTPEDLERARPGLDAVVYRRARHVVTENDRVLSLAEALRAGDLDTLGAALASSHRSLRDDFEVATRELDLAVETAMSVGAIGARMTGGGFGGSAIALVPDDVDPTAALRSAFADADLFEPGVVEVRAARGASRLDM
jgi:galactokinase